MKHTFYSHGKLLLTGEYLVLDNTNALALPTKKGQSMTVEETNTNSIINWRSYDVHQKCWFAFDFSYSDLSKLLVTIKSNKIQHTLLHLLHTAQQLNPSFLSSQKGFKVTTFLEFERLWGLGSSSTLINNIAQWANVNPFELLYKGFGGSGYDIACAQHDYPILYNRNSNNPTVTKVGFNPIFKTQLFFVYLNQKQDSKKSIQHYRSLHSTDLDLAKKRVEELTSKLLICDSLQEFNALIELHEKIIATIIKTPTVKSRLFSDYTGSIKSLGGWGGDFIMVTAASPEQLSYFKQKGFDTIIPYQEMIL